MAGVADPRSQPGADGGDRLLLAEADAQGDGEEGVPGLGGGEMAGADETAEAVCLGVEAVVASSDGGGGQTPAGPLEGGLGVDGSCAAR